MPRPSALARPISVVWLAILAGAPTAARAEPAVLWLDADPPPADVRVQVERTTGPVSHVPGSAMAWPSRLPGPDEESALRSLRESLDDCRGRWSGFDVERGVLWQLEEALGRVAWLGGDEDRARVREALVLQGSALFWAFAPDRAQQAEAATPFLFAYGEARWNGPWVDALALDPDRAWTRSDFPDQTSYEAFLQVRSQVQALPAATLRAPDLPPGTGLVVDGRPAGDPTAVVVAPGHHRVQVVRGGEIAGPGLISLAPGEDRTLAGALSPADLDRARACLLANQPRRMPDPVKAAAKAWREAAGGDPVWLAAWGGHGAPALLPLEGEDPWIPLAWPEEVLLLLEARAGGGMISSDAFREPELRDRPVLAGGGGISAEIAWRSLLLRVEADSLSGAGSITYGTREEGTDARASTWVRLAAAPGIYLLPPRPRGWPWHVALPVGILTPAHMGFGIESGVGVPVGSRSWIRPTLDVWFGTAREGFRGSSAIAVVLRVGYAAKP